MGPGWPYPGPTPFLHTCDYIASCNATCNIVVYDLTNPATEASVDGQMELWGLAGLIRGQRLSSIHATISPHVMLPVIVWCTTLLTQQLRPASTVKWSYGAWLALSGANAFSPYLVCFPYLHRLGMPQHDEEVHERRPPYHYRDC
jgi:hypothetical protein